MAGVRTGLDDGLAFVVEEAGTSGAATLIGRFIDDLTGIRTGSDDRFTSVVEETGTCGTDTDVVDDNLTAILTRIRRDNNLFALIDLESGSSRTNALVCSLIDDLTKIRARGENLLAFVRVQAISSRADT